MDEKVRLQKLLALSGIASRRKAEEMIADGRVTVNGKTASVGDSAVPGKDVIKVDGEKIGEQDKKYYIALHKPRGFVTTMSDEKNRKCVAMLVEDLGVRLFPVGRLDKDSEGLLLMTNDGEFANKISHPSSHVPKTYRVTVRPEATEEQVNKLAAGIMIDGKMTAPADVKVLEEQEGRGVLQITLYEGRNREIRRMCDSLGLEVARLKRTAVGSVRLGMLPQGKYRELTKDEVASLLSRPGKERSKNAADPANGKQGKRSGAIKDGPLKGRRKKST